MPAGRPTAYKPEYCKKVLELGKKGRSVAQMCAHFDVSRQTIDNWAATNPQFLEAYTRAKVHAQAYWEDKGEGGLESRDFNAAVWKVTMQARFRDDYTETKKIEGTFTMLKDVDGVDIVAGDASQD